MQSKFYLLTLKFYILLIQIIKLTNCHVTLANCTERADCLENLNFELVESIRRNLYNETEPCHDYFDYACGEWTAAPFFDHSDNFGAVANQVVKQMSPLIAVDENNNDPEDIKILLQKLRTYYKSCIDTKMYFLPMERYIEELVKMLPKNLLPNFVAILLNGNENVNFDFAQFNWLKVVAELRRFGLNGVFFNEFVGMAADDSTKYVIEIQMPENFDNTESKDNFIYYFEEFFGIENITETHLNFAIEIFEFEQLLLDLRAKHRKQFTDNSLTLEALKQKVTNVDWQMYFDILLNAHAQPDLPIEVKNAKYFQELSSLLQSSDQEVVCFYIVMRLCRYLLNVSPHPTPKNCMDHVAALMPHGMFYIYDRFIYKYRNEDEKVMNDIFENLKLQFSMYLQYNKLDLSANEIEYLQEKLDKMQMRIGNLPLNKTSEFYNNYFAKANISVTNFYRNVWEMLRFRTQKQYERFLEGGERHLNLNDFFVYDDIAHVRNAPYFVHQQNLLIVPLIFVHLPFYYHKLHPVFLYSQMGFILAHEINHAFETQGIKLNAFGNESKIGSAIKNRHKFKTAVKCFSNTKPNSLIERIADVNGFQLAYDTFFQRVLVNENLNFSTNSIAEFAGQFSMEQLYFMNFAQFFCGTIPMPIAHDRDNVRVNEILATMKEFNDVYKCTNIQFENSREKCEMWRE